MRRISRRVILLAAALGAAACREAPPSERDAAPSLPGRPLVRPERYAHSIAALGYPGAKRAFQIGPGSAVFGGDVALEWRWVGPAGYAVTPVYFEDDGVPVAHWTMSAPGVEVRFEAAAMPMPALGDTSLVLSVRATARAIAPEAGGPGESPVTLEVVLQGAPAGPHALPWDRSENEAFEEAWDGHDAWRNGRLVAGIDEQAILPAGHPTRQRPAHISGNGPGALRARLSAVLVPGASQSWDFLVPAYPTAVSAERLRAECRHDDITSSARRAWRAHLNEAAQLVTPDTLVAAAYRAALVTLLVCQERIDADWMSIGNPFQYRDMWVRDGARVVRALAVSGLGTWAQADAWAFRRFQLATGAVLSQRGQLDGSGQALWAFEQAASLPPNPELARRFLPIAEPIFRSLEQQRRASPGVDRSWPGLLPFGDPRDGEVIRAQLLGNDAWALAGYRALVRLARLAGEETLAGEVSSAFEDYRATFVRMLARTGRPDLPPSWQGRGRDWGNLSVGYPTGVLPADDRRLLATADRLWSARGGPRIVSYAHPESLHTYLATDLAHVSLLSGQSAPARAYLADLLAESSSTLGQAEIFHRDDGGFGQNLPPHTTAAATLVDLLRNMIVCDFRDTLEIGLGTSLEEWAGAGFERAPTRFGVVDLTLERPAAEELLATWTPVTVPARIRVPDGTIATDVQSQGARLVPGGRWIECTPGMAQARFRIAPRADREHRAGGS